MYALKGQPARSPGQSEAAPWVREYRIALSPCKGKSIYNRMDALPVFLRFCPFRAETGNERQHPGRRFALPWARRRLPFQGAPPTPCTTCACYFHFNWGSSQLVLTPNYNVPHVACNVWLRGNGFKFIRTNSNNSQCHTLQATCGTLHFL